MATHASVRSVFARGFSRATTRHAAAQPVRARAFSRTPHHQTQLRTGVHRKSKESIDQTAAASPKAENVFVETTATNQAAVTTVCGENGTSISTGAVAVYLDLDNIMASHIDRSDQMTMYDNEILEAILDECSRYGKVVVRRAYGDAVRFSKMRRTMALRGIEMMDLPPHGPQQKNSGDIKLVVDALEAALVPESVVETFVIASGDSDFTPLLAKLRSYGKGTVMMSRSHAMSNLLPAYCDHTVTLEELLARTKNDPEDLELLLKSVHIIQKEGRAASMRRLESRLQHSSRKLQTALHAVLMRHETRRLLDVREEGNHTYVGLKEEGLQRIAETNFANHEVTSLIEARLQDSTPAVNFDPIKHQVFLAKIFDMVKDTPMQGRVISKQLRADMQQEQQQKSGNTEKGQSDGKSNNQQRQQNKKKNAPAKKANSQAANDNIRFSALFIERSLLTLVNAGLLTTKTVETESKKQIQRPNTQHMHRDLVVTNGIDTLEDFRDKLDRFLIHTVLKTTPVKPSPQQWWKVLYRNSDTIKDPAVMPQDVQNKANARLDAICSQTTSDLEGSVQALIDASKEAQSDIVPINVVELERVENVEKPGFFQRFFGGASR